MDGSLHLCHSALCTGLVGRVNESQWLALRDGCAQSVYGAQAHAQVNGIASLAPATTQFHNRNANIAGSHGR